MRDNRSPTLYLALVLFSSLRPGPVFFPHVPVVQSAALSVAFSCSIPQDLPMQSQRFIPGQNASFESSIATELAACAKLYPVARA